MKPMASEASQKLAATVYEEVVVGQGLRYVRAETTSLPMKQLYLTSTAADLQDFSDRQYTQTVTVTSLTSASPAMPLDSRLKAWGRHFEHEFRAYEGREDKKAIFLERWENHLPSRGLYFPEIKSIYNGGPFGAPQVSGKFVAFMAEPADPKFPKGWWRANSAETRSAPSPQPQSPASPISPKPTAPAVASNAVSAMDKFAYRPSFGEKLKDAVSPQLYVWTSEQHSMPKLVKAPENFVFASPNIRPGSSSCSLVVVGYKVKEGSLSKPGISVCFNRESRLFLIENVTSETPVITDITGHSHFLALGPTWSPDGKQLVFTGALTAFATHCTELALFRVPFDDAGVMGNIVEVKPRDSSTEFPGLFLVLHEEARSFRILRDNKTLVFNSNCRGISAVFKIDIFSGALVRVASDEFSLSLIETFSDDILVFLRQSLKSTPQISVFKNDQVVSLNLNPSIDALNGVVFSVIKTSSASGFLLRAAGGVATEPMSPKMPATKAPLLVKIHGGPHACAMNAFSPEIACYLKLGFHVLLPNYRGSAGFGKAFLEALPGECGNFDVQDCHDLTLAAIAELGNSVDTEKVIAYGASHGGFITAHLIGNPDFKNTFSAGVLWNPALDLLASNLTSDIPEWSVCEVDGVNAVSSAFHAGKEFLSRAYDKSAMKFAANVTAPSLVVLGSADLRVNPMAGLRWAQYVEELGNASTNVLWYPDQGHGITGPECADHVIVSIMAWILDRVKS